MEYTTAVHEAGHAVVASAMGMKFAKRAITIVPCRESRKNGVLGQCRVVKVRKFPPEDIAVFNLAGGIAEHRVSQAAPGIGSDAMSMMYTLSVKFDDMASRSNYRWLRASMRWNRNEMNQDAADVHSAVLSLCLRENTADALRCFLPEQAVRLARETHFAFMAEAADTARAILSERWGLVVALATRLLEVGQMSGEELTRFLMFAGVDHVKHVGD